jgi:hypothetical protein
MKWFWICIAGLLLLAGCTTHDYADTYPASSRDPSEQPEAEGPQPEQERDLFLLDQSLPVGLADVIKSWNVEPYRGQSVTLIVNGISEYYKPVVYTYVQSLLIEQGFTFVDFSTNQAVLDLIERQLQPLYRDTSSTLGEWIPADFLAYMNLSVRQMYRSLEGADGYNYFIADSADIRLIDVQDNAVVSTLTLLGTTSTEQIEERAFINGILRIFRYYFMN